MLPGCSYHSPVNCREEPSDYNPSHSCSHACSFLHPWFLSCSSSLTVKRTWKPSLEAYSCRTLFSKPRRRPRAPQEFIRKSATVRFHFGCHLDVVLMSNSSQTRCDFPVALALFHPHCRWRSVRRWRCSSRRCSNQGNTCRREVDCGNNGNHREGGCVPPRAGDCITSIARLPSLTLRDDQKRSFLSIHPIANAYHVLLYTTKLYSISRFVECLKITCDRCSIWTHLDSSGYLAILLRLSDPRWIHAPSRRSEIDRWRINAANCSLDNLVQVTCDTELLW